VSVNFKQLPDSCSQSRLTQSSVRGRRGMVADAVAAITDEARYGRHSVFSGCGMSGSTMRESRCGS
jgi:hypothetical protein